VTCITTAAWTADDVIRSLERIDIRKTRDKTIDAWLEWHIMEMSPDSMAAKDPELWVREVTLSPHRTRDLTAAMKLLHGQFKIAWQYEGMGSWGAFVQCTRGDHFGIWYSGYHSDSVEIAACIAGLKAHLRIHADKQT
jgi:hypothetical protein